MGARGGAAKLNHTVLKSITHEDVLPLSLLHGATVPAEVLQPLFAPPFVADASAFDPESFVLAVAYGWPALEAPTLGVPCAPCMEVPVVVGIWAE